MQTQKERLVVNDLYKVFGDRPAQAMEMVRAGKDKAEIFERTGQTIGVNGASFSVRAPAARMSAAVTVCTVAVSSLTGCVAETTTSPSG